MKQRNVLLAGICVLLLIGAFLALMTRRSVDLTPYKAIVDKIETGELRAIDHVVTLPAEYRQLCSYGKAYVQDENGLKIYYFPVWDTSQFPEHDIPFALIKTSKDLGTGDFADSPDVSAQVLYVNNTTPLEVGRKLEKDWYLCRLYK